ncbi:hypothetical protein [Shimia sp.]
MRALVAVLGLIWLAACGADGAPVTPTQGAHVVPALALGAAE